MFDAKIRIAPDSTIEQGFVITTAIEDALKNAFCRHILVSVTTLPCRAER